MTNPNLDDVKRRDWTILLWHEKTWSERGQTVVSFIIAMVLTAALALGCLYALGEVLGGISRISSEHNRCLQHATNGYEIMQCR